MPGHKKCAFLNCQATTKDNKKIGFFTFPVKYPEICDEWVINCANEGLTSLSVSALKSRIVCERHFEKSCFEFVFPKKRLKKDAVPTVFTQDNSSANPPIAPPQYVGTSTVESTPPAAITPQTQWLQQYEDPAATPGFSYRQPDDISNQQWIKSPKVLFSANTP
jgi:hypothetical protein